MMNGKQVDEWSDDHNGSLALTRTLIGLLNVLLSGLIVLKVFGLV